VALARSGWLLFGLLMLAACAPAPASSSWPAVRQPPTGWASIGSVQGDAASAPVSRLTFSGRPVAVNVACTGAGTVFAIVGWMGVSEPQGAAELLTAGFACGGPADPPLASRVELSSAPTEAADVKVFVLEAESAIRPTTYSVSVEERLP
jgi:hypothetical protein